MKRLFKTTIFIFTAISALFISSCLEIAETMPTSNNPGTVVLKLTDAPFPIDLVDQVLVTIDKIEIHSADSLKAENQEQNMNGNANQGNKGNGNNGNGKGNNGKGNNGNNGGNGDGTGDGELQDSTAFTLLSEEIQEFNLLDLANGITADMVSMEIGPGTYDMIRMRIIESKIILKDGEEYDLKIPSGDKSGLKIKIEPELVVESDVVNEVILDFDVSKSITVKGNANSKAGIKGFNFKPVIRAVSQAQCARVQGTVTDGENNPIEQALVEIMQGDSILTSSFSEADGSYAMIGIPEGFYSMKCNKEGYTDVAVDDVEVIAKKKTIQDFVLTSPE